MAQEVRVGRRRKPRMWMCTVCELYTKGRFTCRECGVWRDQEMLATARALAVTVTSLLL